MKKIKWVVIVFIAFVMVFLLLPEYTRKSLVHWYANVDDYKIFENRTIKTGEPVPWELHPDYNKGEIDQKLRDEMEEMSTLGFLVVKRDSILYEEYFNGHDQQEISNSFSMAKSFVSILIGCAIEDGLINNIDQKVGDFIPKFAEGPNETLTLRHLLSMSSGLNFEEAYNSPFSPTTRSYYGTSIDEQMLELEMEETPGVNYKYLSANTQILAMVVTEVSGMSLAEYASEKLWKPLGAESEALWSLDRDEGMEKAYCCFNATVRDFARIGKMILDSGKVNGETILGKEYFTEMLKPQLALKDEDGVPVDFYGLHWWITQFEGQEVVFARGILGQYIFIIPKKEMVVVRVGKKRSDVFINHQPSDVFTYLEAAFRLI